MTNPCLKGSNNTYFVTLNITFDEEKNEIFLKIPVDNIKIFTTIIIYITGDL